jgi:hypothetical protein
LYGFDKAGRGIYCSAKTSFQMQALVVKHNLEILMRGEQK